MVQFSAQLHNCTVMSINQAAVELRINFQGISSHLLLTPQVLYHSNYHFTDVPASIATGFLQHS